MCCSCRCRTRERISGRNVTKSVCERVSQGTGGGIGYSIQYPVHSRKGVRGEVKDVGKKTPDMQGERMLVVRVDGGRELIEHSVQYNITLNMNTVYHSVRKCKDRLGTITGYHS